MTNFDVIKHFDVDEMAEFLANERAITLKGILLESAIENIKPKVIDMLKTWLTSETDKEM